METVEQFDLLDKAGKPAEFVGPPAPAKPAKRRVRRSKKEAAPAVEVNAEAPAKPKRSRRVKKEKPVEAEPVKYHRINSIPRGYALTHYTVAVLSAVGALTPNRPAVDPNLLAGFYNTKKMLDWHLGNGNLQRTNAGKVRLTPDGRSHFLGLTEGHPNYEKEVKPKIDHLIEKITHGGEGFSEVVIPTEG